MTMDVNWTFALGVALVVILAEIGILLWEAVSIWWVNLILLAKMWWTRKGDTP